MIDGYKIIALCISRIHDLPNYEFINSLNNLLCLHKCRLFVYTICTELHMYDEALHRFEDVDRGDAAVYDLIDYDITDAVIIMDDKLKCHPLSQRIIDRARSNNIPAVIIEGYYENCININFDHRTGMKSVIEHIIVEHGITDIHFMSGSKGNPFADSRREVFMQTLEEHGIPFDESMVSYGDFWTEPTIIATEKIIKSGKIPRAIICANDIMAITVCTILQQAGYSVPQDVIVTGFDGIDEVYLTCPKITTVSCSYKTMAKVAVELIIDYFETGIIKENNTVDCELLIFESCGCTVNSKIDLSTYFANLNNRFFRHQDEGCVMMSISNKMQICSFEDASKLWKSAKHHIEMCCILNASCIDDTINPVGDECKGFEDNMFVFCDSEELMDMQEIKRKDIIPNLSSKLALGIPLLFLAIDYMNVPIGYVCFHFKNAKVTDYQETTWATMALNTAIGGIRDMRYQKHLISQVENMYKYDSLTSLYNRHGFFKAVSKCLKNEDHTGETLNIIITDLDGLKYINDTFGHKEGDNAIKVSALALKHSCPDNALCSRFGGDELISWFFGTYDKDEIENKIHAFLERYNSISKKPYKVSTSVGIFSVPYEEYGDFNKLLSEADKIMYEKKMLKKKNRDK